MQNIAKAWNILWNISNFEYDKIYLLFKELDTCIYYSLGGFMAGTHLEEATELLSANIGNYVSIYHKWDYDKEKNTYLVDDCVVKIVAVNPINMLNPVPMVELEFCDGRKAKFEYESQYAGHFNLLWNYNKTGHLFNDMFVTNQSGRWVFTYPDPELGKKVMDFRLTGGMLHIQSYSSNEQAKDAIVKYLAHLDEAKKNRETERILAEHDASGSSSVEEKEAITTDDLDSIFRRK